MIDYMYYYIPCVEAPSPTFFMTKIRSLGHNTLSASKGNRMALPRPPYLTPLTNSSTS